MGADINQQLIHGKGITSTSRLTEVLIIVV